MNNSISCVIITKNEEKNIGDCINSAKIAVDEIIVVDDFSSDKTVEIAKKFGALVYQKKLVSLGSQKRFGVIKTSGAWVLLLDADERLTKALVLEIKEAVKNHNFAAYNFYFQSFLFGKSLRPTFSGGQILLFRKNKSRIVSDLIHERIVVDGKLGQLKNPLLHYSYPSIFEVVDKFNRYTNPEAYLAYRRGERTNFIKIIFSIPRVFFWRYFLGGEWKDGIYGFIVSVLFGIYHLLMQLKLFEIQMKKGKDKFVSVKYVSKQ